MSIKNLSGNSVSSVWLDDDGMIHKVQPKHLCDNEWWALDRLKDTGFAPEAIRVSDEEIVMEYLKHHEVTDACVFRIWCEKFLTMLSIIGFRHGDLTRPHFFVDANNKPRIIDYAEGRMFDDPLQDKRKEGDLYWLRKTVREILSE